MPQNFDVTTTVQALADAVAMDPKLKGELYSRELEKSAARHNAFEGMCTEANRKGLHGGVKSIFAKKRDLRAGGADTVNFNVIGTPGGPGAMGAQTLSDRVSVAQMATYKATVDWHRDAIFLTRDQVEFLSAGKNLVQTQVDMLGKKIGLLKQNHMMMRLIHGVDGNLLRPNNKMSRDELTANDTLTLALSQSARARLRRLGAMSIKHRLGNTGFPIDGFLVFATDNSMLPLRNDSAFQVALANADKRGEDNSLFTGDLIPWQGMPFYEYPSTDEAWDDYIGSPMSPVAKLGVAFDTDTAAGSCKLITNSANTLSRYFQFFGGYSWEFDRYNSVAADTGKYYAWIINPDGSLGFVEYTGTGNDGNQILIDKILTPGGAGTSTKGATTVGELSVNTTADPDEWTGDNSTLPVTGPAGTWDYTDEFVEGATILQANAKGQTYGRSFVFGSMAACYAHGRIDMGPIKETADFGFAVGRGFELIFGTCVTHNALKKPVSYLVVEHAVDHEGFPTPVKEEA